jgi:hypothetical protein
METNPLHEPVTLVTSVKERGNGAGGMVHVLSRAASTTYVTTDKTRQKTALLVVTVFLQYLFSCQLR